MFTLKFANTYDFSVMLENHLKHVIEDHFSISKEAFCIADGITRDLTDCTPLEYPKNLEEALDIIKKYPNPSGATRAATICSDNFIKYVSGFNINSISERDILDIVKKINNDIYALNANRKIDYLVNDYYAAVAVGGVFSNNSLLGFAIGDCRVIVLNKNLDTLFDSNQNNISALGGRELPLYFKLFKIDASWSNPNFRKFMRKTVRNNSLLKYIKRHTFGALTGEHKAMPFVTTFSFPLANAKYILAFSDGCEDSLNTKEKLASVIEKPSQIRKELHEKTLLIYEKS